jgi:hypothetical protein
VVFLTRLMTSRPQPITLGRLGEERQPRRAVTRSGGWKRRAYQNICCNFYFYCVDLCFRRFDVRVLFVKKVASLQFKTMKLHVV